MGWLYSLRDYGELGAVPKIPDTEPPAQPLDTMPDSSDADTIHLEQSVQIWDADPIVGDTQLDLIELSSEDHLRDRST